MPRHRCFYCNGKGYTHELVRLKKILIDEFYRSGVLPEAAEFEFYSETLPKIISAMALELLEGKNEK